MGKDKNKAKFLNNKEYKNKKSRKTGCPVKIWFNKNIIINGNKFFRGK